MFVMTFRKGGIQKAAIVCVCAALLVASALGVNALLHRQDAAETSATQAVLPTQITGAQELATFLQGYGVEADIATAAVNTVKIPRKWDESFVAFNDCVKESGLDLTKVKGKKADKWMVMVPAQCTESLKTYAVVLVYKSEAVGTYFLQKPTGEVLPMKSAAAAGALTQEEIAAGAGFGAGLESETVAAAEGGGTAPAADAAAQPDAQPAAAVEELSNDGAFPTE